MPQVQTLLNWFFRVILAIKEQKGMFLSTTGSGGPAVGNTQHHINFAESVWRSSFYLQICWENSGQNL